MSPPLSLTSARCECFEINCVLLPCGVFDGITATGTQFAATRVWGSEAGWQRCLPTVPSFLAHGTRQGWIEGEEVVGRTDGARMSPGGFKPFEHQWALAEAFRFCQDIGKARIAARTHQLARQLKEGLAQMPHVTLRTPMSEALRERNLIATVTPYASRYVRLAPSIRNSPAEVDVALAAIHELG